MKKLIIITCLVVALISGLVGGTTLAARTAPPAGTPVLMEANGGFFSILADNNTVQKVCSPTTPDYVHVSLTVVAQGLEEGDEVFVIVSSKGGPEGSNARIDLLNHCSVGQPGGTSIVTVEFDAGRKMPVEPGDLPNTWSLMVKNTEGTYAVKVWWTYTMTYPSSTQNAQ